MNSLDYSILLILIMGLSIGYSRGIFISIISFGGYLAALIGVKLYSARFASFLVANTSIYKIVSDFVYKKLQYISISNYGNTISSIKVPNVFDSSLVEDTQFGDLINKFPFLKNLPHDNIFKFGENIADVFINLIITAVSGMILFILIKIIISIVGNLLNSLIKKSYVLNTTNKMLGLIIGGITAIIVVIVGINFIIPFVYTSSSREISKLFSESIIIKFYYENNLDFNVLLLFS